MPAGHDYVRHLDDPDAPTVRQLPDPHVPGRPSGVWWPHPALEAEWVRAHADEMDVLHLHFGFEHRTPAQLAQLVEALVQMRRPLVLTIHDLTNPHLRDQTGHLAQLDALVPAAAELITLTDAAAEEVARRWGRRPRVLAHPHVAPLAEVGAPPQPARHGRPAVVGLHLKSLRANLDLQVLAPLLTVVAGAADLELRVGLHRQVADRVARRPDEVPREQRDAVRLLQRAAAGAVWSGRSVSGRSVQLDVHDRLSDAALRAALRGVDVLLLPYRHGTHSGMVELCHDLGTAVVASDVGCWQQQQPVQVYPGARGSAGGAPSPEALRAALARALDGPAPVATADGRLAQRRELAAAHLEVYRAAVAAVRGGTAST